MRPATELFPCFILLLVAIAESGMLPALAVNGGLEHSHGAGGAPWVVVKAIVTKPQAGCGMKPSGPASQAFNHGAPPALG